METNTDLNLHTIREEINNIPLHPDEEIEIELTKESLSYVILNQIKLKQADEYHKKSLVLKIAYFGEDNFHLISTYTNLGSIYYY